MRRRLALSASPLLALAACAPVTQGSSTAAPTDRVIMTDMQGQVIRQNAINDHATTSFAAPVPRVWSAVMAAYADLGIEANYADQAGGRYGVRNYTFPKNLRGQRINTLFSCGASLTGDLVDAGTVNAEVVTTMTAAPEGKTNSAIYVSGWVRRNDGNASGPVACTSTGRLEELIRKSVERKLAEPYLAPTK